MKFIFGILLVLGFCSSSLAQGVRPALAKPYLIVPIVLDNRIVNEGWVFPRDDKRNFSIEAKPLIEALETQLRENLLTLLRSRVTAQGVVTIHDLESIGLSVFFDEAKLELRIDLPLKFRRGSDLDLNFSEYRDQIYQRPSRHSGYLTLRSQKSFRYGEDVDGTGLPLTSQLDFVENISGVVLESSANFLEGDEYPWTRQDTRLRYDDEENMNRYTLGDLTLGVRGFQLSPNIAGVSVAREFSIQPYKTLRPLSNTEIVIKRPSTIEVYINGFLYSHLRLAPGIFNIRDFPLALGQNSVRVKVRDDLGQEESYDFSVLFENTLLGKGVHEFLYSGGIPWTDSGGDRAYDDTGIMSMMYHRLGLTDQITVGVNYQNYLSQSLAGLEFSGISILGYLSLEGAYGVAADESAGYAQRIRYRSLDRMFGKDVPVVVTLETENRDLDFRAVLVNGVDPVSYLRRYDAQLNFQLNSTWYFGAGLGTLELARGEDHKFYRSNFVVPINNRTRFEVSYSRVKAIEDEDRTFISFYWSEEQGRYSASAYYDSQQRNANVVLNRNNMHKYDDFRATASLQRDENISRSDINFEYLAQPFTARLEQFSARQNNKTIHTTTAGFNTSLAWVGSKMAFSQPIYDSFVLVTADQLPEGQELMINPNGEKGEAQLGPRRSTVLPERSAYYKYTVNLDSTSLPVGYLLEKEYYNVQPTYRSGLLLELNLQRKIMIKGRLLNEKGKVLEYVAGDVFNEQDQLVDNTFFTNKSGGFLIEGLEPGKYKLVTDQPYLKPVFFEVTDAPGNNLNLGDITVKEDREW